MEETLAKVATEDLAAVDLKEVAAKVVKEMKAAIHPLKEIKEEVLIIHLDL